MLLDEASANIDALTDATLQKTLRTCFTGSTLLIIAHRLSTIADADLLVCMDK
ncbi:abcC8, partial [Symbiodinium necroappetens]